VARLPTPKLPRLGGVAERIRAAGRRLLYTLEDVAGLIAGAAEAASDAVRRAWWRLSLRTRQRVALGLAGLLAVAVVWLVAIPNLPCEFPGGDRCPPPDDAAEQVPDDALAYVHANLDPESEQYQDARELASRTPNFASELIAGLPGPRGGELDFGRDVSPWLGDELALAIVPGEGGEDESLFLYEVEDEGGAEEFAGRLATGEVTDSEREEVEISVDERGLATAQTGGFLIVGSEVAVEGAIDAGAEEGSSLADSSVAESVAEALPEDNLVDAFLSDEGVQQLLSGAGGSAGSLDTFVNFEATRGAGAALVASDDGLELALHSELDPERLEASPGFFEAFPPFEPTLVEDLSADSLAYLGLGDPRHSIQELLDQAQAGAPELASGFEDLSQELERSGRVSLESEILPVLGGQAAFAIEPGASAEVAAPEAEAPAEPEGIPGIEEAPPGAAPPGEVEPPAEPGSAPGVVEPTGIPYLSFIASEVDTEAARDAIAKLQGPLADALEPGEGGVQAPVIEENEIGGVETLSIRVSPAVNLTFAAFDGTLVVSTDPEGVRRLSAGEGGLEDAEPFERATEDFPDEPRLLAYFNLAELVVLAEREGLAEDPAYAIFAGDIRQLDAAALAVERTNDGLDTTLRVALRRADD
jgi:hypothetical protein